ncbi:putative pentatricopeptide repeat-containing protein-like [Iris pallida]|uniref:Pentatricopeptide repeat-containing protein-like n=1 Tax=Iris pallida TaxID=29817 RepID=A0AAX6EQF5_IRIPA|nr:putative pentatricopeptide repeat-containing protein-like [Iris pallida]
MIRSPHKSPLLINNNIPHNIYSKYSNKPAAHNLFDKLPIRKIVPRNPLNAGCTQMGLLKNACSDGSEFGGFSYADALTACARTGDLMNGKILHGLVVVGGFACRPFLTNRLIDMYSNCRKIDEVRLIFDYADEVDDDSWNLLLSAYVHIGWPEVAANILVWMHRSGVKLNTNSFVSVLKACSGSSDSKESRMLLHRCIVKVGLDLYFLVGSAMFDIYAESDRLDEAIEILDRIPNRSLVVFNALIVGFSLLESNASAEIRVTTLKLFSEMLRRRMRPSRISFNSVLEACSSTHEFMFSKQIHAQVIKRNLDEDEFIRNALINVYASSSDMDEGFKCFNSTTNRDTVTWGSMIQGYVQNGQIERAMVFYREMLRVGLKPDQFAASSLLRCSGNFGVLRSGQQIQCYAVKVGLDQFTVCCNSQIILYAKSGVIDAATKTFQETATTDAVSWSAVILSHALHGWPYYALALFEEMKDRMVLPNDATFLAVLTACRHGGVVDEGFRYLKSMMTEYGLTPNPEHCVCIVDFLGRSGRLDEAEKFISSSGFNNDKTVWWALLRSCQFHCDTERSIRVGEKLLEIDPFTSTSYFMLYNSYLDIGDVSKAMRTRGRMRELGVNKEAAICWIEIGPTVHSFKVGDDSHPQNCAIFTRLEEMMLKLKKQGCADVNILELEYRSEKWKESLFSSHGEILAVAMGMIFLPESMPIRVMKNLRVCEDCHKTLKWLSESERREIILRDSIHFHHFSWGFCSCGEYW